MTTIPMGIKISSANSRFMLPVLTVDRFRLHKSVPSNHLPDDVAIICPVERVLSPRIGLNILIGKPVPTEPGGLLP